MYCPHCDMDFVHGVTVCSDCGGQLVNKEEYFKAKAEKESQELEQEEKKKIEKALEIQERLSSLTEDDLRKMQEQQNAFRASLMESTVFVDKESKYKDNKSSFVAFIIVGSALTILAILLWTGVLKLPVTATSEIILNCTFTALGLIFLGIAAYTYKTAEKLKVEVTSEKEKMEDDINWFLETFDGHKLDVQIDAAYGVELAAEEKALIKLQVINDTITKYKDIPDKAYANELAEEIYARMYEE